jgi:ribosomal protein S18 acetylase RimI-like enzyme
MASSHPRRPVIIRRLRTDEAILFKTLRLRALADSPDAFAHTYDEIRARPDSYWAEMTRSVTEPDRHAMFVAEDETAPVGMAFGLLDREDPGRAHLGGMWVEPDGRGGGVGRALADAVVAWARERGFGEVVLWVTEGNKRAIDLYERVGFAVTGRRDRLPSNDRLDVIEMRLALSTRTP